MLGKFRVTNPHRPDVLASVLFFKIQGFGFILLVWIPTALR